MKNLVAVQALRAVLLIVVGMAYMSSIWADNSNRQEVLLPGVAGFTLEPGNMYVVSSDMTITASHGNGLNVAPKGSGQAPILYIPAGVTLNVKGADAQGIVGGGAGIYVPTDAELIITGAGTLNATGGAAGNGQAGENGQHAGGLNLTSDLRSYTEFITFSGAGGHGGHGGGGAGAGIGGNGGQGGQGGQGGVSVYFTNEAAGETNATQKDGNSGFAGEAGEAGTAMGKVSITGTVKVKAASGAAGTAGGAGGVQGYSAYYDQGSRVLGISVTYRYIAGAGGAGGGGGAGYAAPQGIGAGGRGAGGGAGGGSGAVDWVLDWAYIAGLQFSGRAASGAGGVGAVNGINGSQERPADTGGVATSCPKKGGAGGAAGIAGTEAVEENKGTLYAATPANVTGRTASSAQQLAPTDMQITITFVNNELDQKGDKVSNVPVGQETVNIGESLPDLAVASYRLPAHATKYFAGYYTEQEGHGSRIYKGIATGDKLDKVSTLVNFASDVTLYAHFTHVHHTVYWDYTYSDGIDSNGTSTWKNLNYSEYLQYGKLIFYGPMKADGTRDAIKEIKMSAYNTNKDNATENSVDQNFIYKANPTAGAENHTRSVGQIYLHVGSGTDQLSTSGDINVYFTDDELSQFRDYEFIPCDKAGNTVNHWEAITERAEHVTIFSFTGAKVDNEFVLQWNVTLTGLKVYPDHIYAKPLYWDGQKWALISQLPTRYDGVACPMSSHVDNQDPSQSSATYSGEYPVWISQSGNEYGYKVGLVGFTLNGEMYYMDSTHGDVSQNDMQSVDSRKCSDDNHSHTINMTVEAAHIPVLRLMPNGGKLSDTTPAIMVNDTRKGTFSLVGCSAERAGYKLAGWNTAADGSGTRYETTSTNVPGSGAITLYAEWSENVAPVIAVEDVEYLKPGVKLTVSVTDASSVTVYSHIADGESQDLSKETDDKWSVVSLKQGSSDLYEISITNNRSRAYIWIKAVDAAGNVAYYQTGNLRVDGIAPTVFLYPTGNVCNFDGQFTITDDVEIAKIEIKHEGEVDWKQITDFKARATNIRKEFTLPKPTAATLAGGEGYYSIKVTDGAGNVTEIDNIIRMYYDHDFAHGAYHEAKDPTAEADGALVNHYHCTNDCGHIWATDVDKCGPLNNYNRDSETQKYAQGLMRAETNASFLPAASYVIKDENGKTIGAADGQLNINDVITMVGTHYNNYTIKFTTDKNVGAAGASTLVTPDNPVNIDLNGCSVLVNGNAGTVNGNEKVTFVLTDESGYKNQSTITGSPVTYKRDMTGSSNWGTLVLPFTVKSTDTFKLYTLSSANGSQLTFSEATTVKANTPCMYKKKNAVVLNFTGTELVAASNGNPANAEVNGWRMVGCYETVTLSKHEYYIKSDAFKYAVSNITVKPFRAWIVDTTAKAGEARNLTFVVSEEEATSLSDINATQQEVIYDLMGRRLSSPKKGQINFINGKITLVK